MNNNAKPWYKVWWIWVIIGIAFFILVDVIAVSANTSGDSSSSSDVKTTQETAKDSSSDDAKKVLSKQYKVGETIDYKGYKVKVNDIKYSDGDEFETPKSGNKYIAINVTIENDTDQKQDYNEYDFKLSADGNAKDLDAFTGIDEYDDNGIDSGTLEKGAKVTGYLVGEANPNAKLKLQYQPNYFDNNTVDIDLN